MKLPACRFEILIDLNHRFQPTLVYVLVPVDPWAQLKQPGRQRKRALKVESCILRPP